MMQEVGNLTWGLSGVNLIKSRERKEVSGDSDGDIIERVLNGEIDAFSVLVERYQDRIYSAVANYVGSGEDAVDLVQDVFVKAYAGLKSFQGTAAFYTWLYRIAMNTAIDFLRRRPIMRPVSLDDENLRESGFEPVAKDPLSDPEKTVLNRTFKAAMMVGIARLSPKLKTALVLHDIERLSQEEVAKVLNCPVGTVKSRVSRARMELRSMLAKYFEGGR